MAGLRWLDSKLIGDEMKNRISVKVVSVGVNRVPLNFPWLNGVHLQLQGDLSDLDNLQKELTEVKQFVNKDISKFNMNLKDFKIKIEWC